MNKRVEKNILKKGDIAYYSSRQFFPKETRSDIAKLYSFVRVVSDYVYASPADIESFKYIVRRWQAIKKNKDFGHFKPLDNSINERVLSNICFIINHYDCDASWVDDFLRSMAMDIRAKSYNSIRDTVDYMHGSSEVIAQMMAKIMRLPNASIHFDKMQGRAFEIINFMRDLNTDIAAGRNYFPLSEVKKFGLAKLDETNALKHPEEFKKFIRFQIKRYRLWQQDADKGLQFVPRRMKIAVHAAIDVYAWMAKKIDKDPYIVFEKRIKPRRTRVHRAVTRRLIRP
jgi:phytoene synthase